MDKIFIDLSNFICPICCDIFKIPYICPNCEKTICEKCLGEYKKTCIDNGIILVCPFCKNDLLDYHKNEEKLNLLSSNKIYYCIKCQQKFDNTDEFEKHNKNCYLKCKECHNDFKDWSNFLKHIKNNHLDIAIKKMTKNIVENKYLKENKSDLDKNKQKEIQEKTYNLSFCNLPNNIKCNCCKEKICKKGNCMCKKCMIKNIKNLGLEKYHLINKKGKVCKINYINNDFECFCNCNSYQKKKINNNIHYIPIQCGKETIIDCKKYCDECIILKDLLENYLTKEELNYLINNNKN
jgi:uncharacterized protein YbaR (Trm112 family)